MDKEAYDEFCEALVQLQYAATKLSGGTEPALVSFGVTPSVMREVQRHTPLPLLEEGKLKFYGLGVRMENHSSSAPISFIRAWKRDHD